MRIFEAFLSLVGVAGSFLMVGAVLLGIPWALYTLARTGRSTDEILRVQRDILRELRRVRAADTAEAPPTNDEAPPSQRR